MHLVHFFICFVCRDLLIFFFRYSCVPESQDFHSQSKETDQPVHFATLELDQDERLLCPPVAIFSIFQKNINNPFESPHKLVLRGDSNGRICVWTVPNEFPAAELEDAFSHHDKKIILKENMIYSLQKAWQSMRPLPGGIFDQFVTSDRPKAKVTASVYLPYQGRLVCGREDGSIIIISATYTIMSHLLAVKKRKRDDWPQHQILEGHAGRVNCLLYPHHSSDRYDIAYLISGGVDFSVCLWDIYAGTLIHRFSVHAGEITQLCVPPKDCSPRVLQCICSIASDHSGATIC